MRPKLRLYGMAILVVCALAFLVGTLRSSEDHMNSLPVNKHFGCTLCHVAPNPTVGTDLNSFGKDFQANGLEWNADLAAIDSDGDGFSNGLELGDENGDGTPEVYFERSNPGDPFNYPNSINQETWSIIKSLFED
ncbi:MAG: hypothetical protein JSV33_00530 [bacterium]|nr:MAG: hypothetical protein JSV33_00530 [bacterium]